MNDSQLKNLVRKYLNGQCSDDEHAQIRAILKNEDSLHLFNEVWDEEPITQDIPNVSEEKLRSLQNKIHDKIHSHEKMENETGILLIKEEVKNKFLWMRYAAAILICIGASWLWFSKRNVNDISDSIIYAQTINGKARRSQITLADGTIVYLGAESKLRYPKSFTSGTREVILEGEAFFQVTKNPAKPFIIRTGNIQTRVLGTSFKVDAIRDHPFKVSVVTGRVQVEKHNGQHMQMLAVLTPGQSVLWDHNHKTISDTSISDVQQWKNGVFVFNHTSFAVIAENLETYYDVKFTFKRTSLKGIPLTATFNTTTMPLGKLLNVLSVTGGFKFKINGKSVIIY